jgi:hypothetical protein
MTDEPEPELEPDDDERKQALVEQHAGALMEHFASVIIICTSSDERGWTGRTVAMRGNWYANYGALSDWVGQQEAQSKSEYLKYRAEADEEEGEDDG